MSANDYYQHGPPQQGYAPQYPQQVNNPHDASNLTSPRRVITPSCSNADHLANSPTALLPHKAEDTTSKAHPRCSTNNNLLPPRRTAAAEDV